MKITYMLGGEGAPYYSPYLRVFRIRLERNSAVKTKWEQFSQYGTFGLFVGLQLLDMYYSRQHTWVKPDHEVEAPKVMER